MTGFEEGPKPTFCHVFIGLERATPPHLEEAHQLALSSIKQALQFRDGVEVTVLAVVPPGGRSYSDLGFGELKVDRDARDIWPQVSKPLVLADDFFSAAMETKADFYIFTNPDICVTRSFYSLAASIVISGISSWTAHRRTVTSAPPSKLGALEWGEIVVGEPHPGSDLFVMSRDIALKLSLPGVVMGMPLSGSAVIAQLSLLDSNFTRFDDLNISFHYGDERDWKRDSRKQYILQHREAVRANLERWLATSTDSEIRSTWKKAGVDHLLRLPEEARTGTLWRIPSKWKNRLRRKKGKQSA